jgi:hypothetical protein
MIFKGKKVNRIEIIGDKGREMVKYLPSNKIGIVEFQDNGKTLKIFIEDKTSKQNKGKL